MPINLNNIKFILLSYFIVIISFYSSVLTSTYAFLDDFGTIENALAGLDAPYVFDISSGRPLFALFRIIDGVITSGIEDLWMQRSFSVISLFALAVFINRFITKIHLFNRDEYNFTFPLMIALLPSFQVYSSWATCYPFTLAVLFSGLSYSCLTSSFFNKKLVRWLISWVFICCSFAIYQPAGMAFMAFALLDQCLSPKSVNYRVLFNSFVMMCSGMLSSLIMIKVVPLLAFGQTLSRSTMTDNPTGKIRWFFGEAIPNSLANYSISASEPMLIIGLVFFCMGLAYIYSNKDGIKKVLFTLVFIAGSYFPNLYVSESWAAQRSIVAMSICIVAVSLFGLMKFSDFLFTHFRIKGAGVLSVLLIASAGVTATGNINNYMISNQISEIESVASEISNKVDKSFSGAVMVDISKRNWGAFSRIVRYDEFGENSVYAPWAARGILLTIKKSKGFSYSVPKNPVISNSNNCSENCITIQPNEAMLKSTLNY